MLRCLVALLSGGLFGVGLALSGMTDTRVVLGFLDVAGQWDPRLAFVLGGALAVTLPGYALARRRARPMLEVAFHLPTARQIDGPLLAGAALFGAGWGLYGYCPGPALASLSSGHWQPLVFVVAMAAGMLLRDRSKKGLTVPGEREVA